MFPRLPLALSDSPTTRCTVVYCTGYTACRCYYLYHPSSGASISINLQSILPALAAPIYTTDCCSDDVSDVSAWVGARSVASFFWAFLARLEHPIGVSTTAWAIPLLPWGSTLSEMVQSVGIALGTWSSVAAALTFAVGTVHQVRIKLCIESALHALHYI